MITHNKIREFLVKKKKQVREFVGDCQNEFSVKQKVESTCGRKEGVCNIYITQTKERELHCCNQYSLRIEPMRSVFIGCLIFGGFIFSK